MKHQIQKRENKKEPKNETFLHRFSSRQRTNNRSSDNNDFFHPDNDVWVNNINAHYSQLHDIHIDDFWNDDIRHNDNDNNNDNNYNGASSDDRNRSEDRDP